MSATLEVIVPTIGESISSGVLSAWIVKDGGFVEKGQPLFELETDKASTEVPALASGILRHIAKPGDEVEIGSVVARIESSESTPVGAPAAKAAAANGPAAPARAESPKAPPPQKEKEDTRVVASSVARKIAEDHGIELSAVKGSGTSGRITREDVEAEVAKRSTQPTPEAAPAAPARPEAPAAAATNSGDQTREKMSMLRRRIAERLVEAQHNAAMLTTFNDVDMSAVLALRSQYKDSFKDKHGVGLGFMSFFVRASVEALRTFPRVNAFIDGQEIVYNHRQHIGVAVSTERGLIVPVIRNAGDLSFAGVEQTIVEFAKRARENKIELAELQGGTFTISNGGVFGSMLSTPILNPPQSAILGMHRIEERPVARDGQVVIKPMMYLALSYDHRIVDGREAVGFLVRIKECIENPSRILLSV